MAFPPRREPPGRWTEPGSRRANGPSPPRKHAPPPPSLGTGNRRRDGLPSASGTTAPPDCARALRRPATPVGFLARFWAQLTHGGARLQLGPDGEAPPARAVAAGDAAREPEIKRSAVPFTPARSVAEAEVDANLSQRTFEDVHVRTYTAEETKEAFDVARNSIERLSTVLSSSPQQDALQIFGDGLSSRPDLANQLQPLLRGSTFSKALSDGLNVYPR
ncbi:hypothetical protein E2562_031105 [Oryza meyeriana var. granulata]|uniref:Uncharacterized protein n=1 Tax=Oryza meyeriana var. granulata TaxID=110450 RepID=A0A6G1CKS3_9ORYZ|nr:hypothetical protein E2562_031105 [Oryza meyeriana var. granulata]